MGAAVLFISPYFQDARVLGLMLAEASILLIHVTCLRDAVKKLDTEPFQAVLTESKLDDGQWFDLLLPARTRGAEIVVTDLCADARFWAEAINLGAFDVLAQPFQAAEARRVMLSACTERNWASKRQAAS